MPWGGCVVARGVAGRGAGWLRSVAMEGVVVTLGAAGRGGCVAGLVSSQILSVVSCDVGI